MDQEELLDGIILCVVEEEANALVQTVLDEYHSEMFKLQKGEVSLELVL